MQQQRKPNRVRLYVMLGLAVLTALMMLLGSGLWPAAIISCFCASWAVITTPYLMRRKEPGIEKAFYLISAAWLLTLSLWQISFSEGWEKAIIVSAHLGIISGLVRVYLTMLKHKLDEKFEGGPFGKFYSSGVMPTGIGH